MQKNFLRGSDLTVFAELFVFVCEVIAFLQIGGVLDNIGGRGVGEIESRCLCVWGREVDVLRILRFEYGENWI